MSQTIIPSPDQHREPRATYVDEENRRFVFDDSPVCSSCTGFEPCDDCDGLGGFTETVEHFEHFESFSDVADEDGHEPRPTAHPTPAMEFVGVSVEFANDSWFVFIDHDKRDSLFPVSARRMAEALSDAADIAARLNAPAGITDSATINARMVAAVTGSRLTLTQWARELGLSVPALRRRLSGTTAWTVGNLATVARVHGLSPAVVVADLPEVRRPVDQCAEPQLDGRGGGL